MLHQVCDRVLSITDTLLELRRYQGHRFRLVETEAPGEPLLCEEACLDSWRVRNTAASISGVNT